MDFYTTSTWELETLANQEPTLNLIFGGVRAADQLPDHPVPSAPRGYIVNTDSHDQPGQHWIALWTQNDGCQIMDSYALPLETYQSKHLIQWINKHWSVMERNNQSLQAINSATCGHYALKFLVERSQGRSFRQFLDQFKLHDYVYNDTLVARWLQKKMLRNVINQ